MGRGRRDLYGSVLDVVAGIQKEEEWRDHESIGAGALTLDQVQKIMLAKVKFPDGAVDNLRLRNKVIAVLMVVNHVEVNVNM